MYKTSSLEADGLQQQKTTEGATLLNYKQELKATVCTGSQKLDNNFQRSQHSL